MARRSGPPSEVVGAVYQPVDYSGGSELVVQTQTASPITAQTESVAQSEAFPVLTSMDQGVLEALEARAELRAQRDVEAMERRLYESARQQSSSPFGILGTMNHSPQSERQLLGRGPLEHGSLGGGAGEGSAAAALKPNLFVGLLRNRAFRIGGVAVGLLTSAAFVVPKGLEVYSNYTDSHAAAELRATLVNHPDIMSNVVTCTTPEQTVAVKVAFSASAEITLPIPAKNVKTKQVVKGNVSGPGVRHNSVVNIKGCGVKNTPAGAAIALATYSAKEKQYVVNRAAIEFVGAEFAPQDSKKCNDTITSSAAQLCMIGFGNTITVDGALVTDKKNYITDPADPQIKKAKNYIGLVPKTTQHANPKGYEEYQKIAIAKTNALILQSVENPQTCTDVYTSADRALKLLVQKALQSETGNSNAPMRFTNSFTHSGVDSLSQIYAGKYKSLVMNNDIFVVSKLNQTVIGSCAAEVMPVAN